MWRRRVSAPQLKRGPLGRNANVNPSTRFLCLALLSLACAGRANEAGRSVLLATPCGPHRTTDSNTAFSVKVEPEHAHNEYLQLTVFAIRSGQPDSVVTHAVREAEVLGILPPGLYRLRVRSLGYQTVTDTLRLAPGDSWCVTARLADAIALAPAPVP